VDEQDREPESEGTEPITERVRIVGAETASVLAGEQAPAGGTEPGAGGPGEADAGQREQRYLGFVHHAARPSPPPEPPPPPDTGHLAAVSPELPHWSDPPTGQVPAVIDRRNDEGDDATWSAFADSGPVWREHEHEWEDTRGFEPAMLADEGTRVGALDETPVEDRRPWEFEDLGRDERSPHDEGGGSYDLTAEQPAVVRSWEEEFGPPAVPAAAGAPGPVGAEETGPEGSAGSWWDEEAEDGGWATGTSAPAPSAGPTDPSMLRTAAVPLVGDPLASSAPAPASAGVGSAPGTSAPPGERLSGEERDEPEDVEGLDRPASPPTGVRPGTGRRRGAARPGPAPAPPAGRRNVPLAVATGVVAAAVVVLCLYAGPLATVVLATTAFTLAAAEVYAASRRAGRHPATLLGLVGTVALMIAAYDKGVAALPLVTVLVVMTAMAWYLIGADTASAVEGISSTLLGFGWVAVLGSFAALMAAPSVYPHRHGLAFLLGAVVATVAADVGALAVGSWVGRHPLAPHVSPNKTWEGWIGGAVLSVAASVAITGHVHPWTPAKAAVLGVVVAVLAPVGDLCESLVKRDLGVKDLGSLLPGHGGVVDRVDALLFVLPATYYLVRVLHLG
jgi:CDP-diglyceride synthetase